MRTRIPRSAATVFEALLRRLIGSRVRIVGGYEGILRLVELDVQTGALACYVEIAGAGSFWRDWGDLRFLGQQEHCLGGPAA